MKHHLRALVIVFFCLSVFYNVKAQENFYRVYQFETPYKGHLEITNWTSYVAKSSESYDHFGKSLSRNQLLATSIEAEYGVGDHFVLAAYADFDDPKTSHLDYSQAKIEARYRFSERFDHFINTALYAEYIIPNQSYSNSQEIEARLILDKDINDFRIAVNPTVTKYVNGDEDQSWKPAVSAGLYYRRIKLIQPGIEFYENFTEKAASLFPTIDLNIGGSIIWNLGAGFRLNEPADKLIFKSILQVDIQAIRPSRFMRKKYSTPIMQ